MKSTERLPFTQWADIHRTERFISVEPLSGYRRALPEDNSDIIYLPPDANDIVLGRALLEALAKSRFIWPDDEPEFFMWQRYMQCYKNRQKDFMRRYGYKTKREAYENMNWCHAERSEGKISLAPRKSDKPGYWIFLPERTVIIPATTDAAVAGEALRLGLDRCE
ncbi:MAG TPA: contact-dependent growth inhibition system immunity protein [Beijerinckiaceae bacterium]|nr:contact-dependent growth inhibition system immunity protein [Beijerinckiaceae bacterium]